MSERHARITEERKQPWDYLVGNPYIRYDPNIRYVVEKELCTVLFTTHDSRLVHTASVRRRMTEGVFDVWGSSLC